MAKSVRITTDKKQIDSELSDEEDERKKKINKVVRLEHTKITLAIVAKFYV
jgi:hypothetical protein